MDGDRVQRAQHTVTGWPGPGGPAHADRPRRRTTAPGVLVVLTGALLLAALGLGAAGCLTSPESSKSTPTSASLITVSPAAR